MMACALGQLLLLLLAWVRRIDNVANDIIVREVVVVICCAELQPQPLQQCHVTI